MGLIELMPPNSYLLSPISYLKSQWLITNGYPPPLFTGIKNHTQVSGSLNLNNSHTIPSTA